MAFKLGRWDLDVDVVCVGSGLGGIAAAIVAHDQGRKAIVLEKAPKLGGVCAYSGGEVFVPRIPSMRIMDLVEAVAPGSETYEIGIRPGEKLHEEMISLDDARRTLRLGDRYVVLPTIANWGFAPTEGEPGRLSETGTQKAVIPA